MDIALFTVAVIGFLLFLFSYIKLVRAGFKQHPVTGLIAAIPIVNIIIMPTLFDRVSKSLIFGFLGLILFFGAMKLGAKDSFDGLFGSVGVSSLFNSDESNSSSGSIELPLKPSAETKTVKEFSLPNQNKSNELNPPLESKPQNVPVNVVKEKEGFSFASFFSGLFDKGNQAQAENGQSNQIPLKPLYQLKFITADIKELPQLANEDIKIKLSNLNVIEGQLLSTDTEKVSLSLKGNNKIISIAISDIQSVSVLRKIP